MCVFMKQLAAKRLMPTKRDVADVEVPHHQGHQRDQQELRQAGPGEHLPDLLGIVALHLPQILRQDVDRAEQREADQHVGERADAEIAVAQQPQVDQRLLDGELDPDEGGQEHRRHHGQLAR